MGANFLERGAIPIVWYLVGIWKSAAWQGANAARYWRLVMKSDGWSHANCFACCLQFLETCCRLFDRYVYFGNFRGCNFKRYCPAFLVDERRECSQRSLLDNYRKLSLWLGYCVWPESSPRQGTIGKKIFGLKVVDLEGKRVSFWRSLVRYLGMLAPGFIFYIGFWCACGPKRSNVYTIWWPTA